jgi:hypothetical protein
VLAYRIMARIIEEYGNNSWLYHGTPHAALFVRRDFMDVYDGIVPNAVVISCASHQYSDWNNTQLLSNTNGTTQAALYTTQPTLQASRLMYACIVPLYLL